MAHPNPAQPQPSTPKIAPTARSTTDPILRNALRYTISAKEYETLHRYILSRSKLLKRSAPSVARVERLEGGGGEAAGGGRGEGAAGGGFGSDYNAAAVRASLRVFLASSAVLRVWGAVKGRLLGSRRAGRTPKTPLWRSPNFCLSLSLSTILLLHRILFRFFTRLRLHLLTPEARPFRQRNKRTSRTLTSALAPAVGASLLHAFVFNRDCFPKYVQSRPDDYPSSLPWPGKYEMVDSLAEMARLNYPKFVSPILFPNITTLPPTLSAISPITSPAHPLITSLTCATLHPLDPSCTRTYLSHHLLTIPPLAKFFTLIFSLLSVPLYAKFYASPLTTLNKLAARILRYTVFVSGSIGTSWAAICFFQSWFPAKGWWNGVKGGDVWIFVASLVACNVVFERDAKCVNSGMVRRSLGFLRGEGLADRVKEEKKRLED
ncbi:hypothetical protein BUE80_DR010132 [Diplocarpon rosae]|nr:hypothetical protein BUE80_DR010132 [Diplocarpon rosae]